MASRIQQNVVKRFGPRIKEVGGRFFPNGTSTSALTVVCDGGIASVIRTSNAGEFTITLQDTYAQLLDFSLGVQHTTAVDLKAQMGNVDLTAKTIIVRLLAVATGTDMTANANSSVSFNFKFRDSSRTSGNKP